jgi:hypothetical protein
MAQPPARPVATLRWQVDPAPERCPEQARFSGGVEARLGRSVFRPASPSTHTLEARIVEAGGPEEPTPGRFRGSLRLLAPDGAPIGTRELDSTATGCGELVDALALAAALMLDYREREIAAPAPRPKPAPFWGLAARATGAVGFLPSPALGAGLELRGRAFRLPPVYLQATLWPDRERRVEGSGARAGALLAGLGLCPLGLVRGALEGALCAGATAGWMRTRGVALDVTRDERPFHVALDARARLGVRIAGPVWLEAELGAAVPLRRLRLAYLDPRAAGGGREVYRAAPIAGLGALSLASTFR